jgi:uncharacterized protein YaaQ
VVLLGSKAIPQGGPLQRGRITLLTGVEDAHAKQLAVILVREGQEV